jgi:hypothetical protein
MPENVNLPNNINLSEPIRTTYAPPVDKARLRIGRARQTVADVSYAGSGGCDASIALPVISRGRESAGLWRR